MHFLLTKAPSRILEMSCFSKSLFSTGRIEVEQQQYETLFICKIPPVVFLFLERRCDCSGYAISWQIDFSFLITEMGAFCTSSILTEKRVKIPNDSTKITYQEVEGFLFIRFWFRGWEW